MTDIMKAVAEHLAMEFSTGNDSIHHQDELSGGDRISCVIHSAILEARKAGEEDLADAFETISQVWGNGFELASGADMATNDKSVSEIVCGWYDEQSLSAENSL